MTTTNMLFPVPTRHGAYRPRVSIKDRAMTISVDYAAKKWLPYCLFGETIHTKQFALDGTSVHQPLSVDNTPEGLLLTSGATQDGGSQASNVVFSPAWDMSFRADAYRKMVNALHGQPAVGKRKALKIGAALFAAYVLTSALLTKGPQPAAVASNDARANLEALAKKASANSPSADTKAAMQAALQQVLGDVGASSGKIAQENARRDGPIKLSKEIMETASAFQYKPGTPNAKQIVVWSDPMCSHCHDFDANILTKLPASVGVNVLPVSFRDYSRIYAGYALCGRDVPEKVARWKDLMLPEPKADVSSKCEEGVQKVDRNTTLFVRAGLTLTPTISSADGQQIFTGNLESLADVTAWINGLK